eukprot:TRINITY_DN4572_c0_g1_i5.p1 TRINITY_DN4572_c0_g1~~TRINITY_DN4572_c0_g1_i5.p1  ORF type:complete len:212 (-),score=30.29 TRINITY_DN4572_c0_g1_i5:114-749(-)
MDGNTKETPIDTLPEDVYPMILRHMTLSRSDIRWLLNLSVVSRKWNKLMEKNWVWQPFLSKIWEGEIPHNLVDKDGSYKKWLLNWLSPNKKPSRQSRTGIAILFESILKLMIFIACFIFVAPFIISEVRLVLLPEEQETKYVNTFLRMILKYFLEENTWLFFILMKSIKFIVFSFIGGLGFLLGLFVWHVTEMSSMGVFVIVVTSILSTLL